MERTFTLGIVILIALTAFAQVSPINRENDSNVMRRNSLLEKLGMELCRDPFNSQHRKRGVWRRWQRRYRKRKGKKESGKTTTGSASPTDSDTASGTDSESRSGLPCKDWRYGKYGKYGYRSRYSVFNISSNQRGRSEYVVERTQKMDHLLWTVVIPFE